MEPLRLAEQRVKIGMTAASVFPEPVGATRRAHLLLSSTGKAFLCMGVGSAQPNSFTCWRTVVSKDSGLVVIPKD